MLDQTTKRKIDSARDILVGKVPDPKAQVEQITTALIYKFMDDMDKESEEIGGKIKFFADDFSQYSWTKLLDKRLSGQGRIDLYTQAIAKMSGNKNIPPLFRDIFKNAFLPFHDPQTLTLFLKEINEFTYDNSENLGDAFEYLLSVLGSQGDAGQFRTPRHIIDFIIEIVNPKKNETILDPSCGTAGFLISAYKHIVENNDGKDKTGKPTDKEKPLTPDEKKKLMDNIVGYDISPDMVKLSLVNMYLHGFQNPKIHEYDTLTSDQRWNEMFNVIVANPPFMTPTGGIRPHKKFSIQASRSEVLFVDYIMEHLHTNGRAGVIVPEGIIFKGDKAYKQLRKALLEDGLSAVVSLPRGVFKPYSGVKTSILIFDKEKAKKTDEVLFIKIENDGFDLGDKRQPIDKNDLPEALEILEAWKQGRKKERNIALWVEKEKIAESGNYHFDGKQYISQELRKLEGAEWVKLDDVFVDIKNGRNVKQKENVGRYKVSRIKTIADGKVDLSATKWTDDKVANDNFLKEGDILFSHINSFEHLAKTAIFDSNEKVVHGINLLRFRSDKEKIEPYFALYLFKSQWFIDEARKYAQKAVNQASINVTNLKKIKIPLPPPEIQKQIVEEIEVKQNAINHAKEIIKNLEKERQYFGREIEKLGDIKMVKLSELTEIVRGGSPRPINKYITNKEDGINWIKIGDVREGEKYVTKTKQKIKREGLSKTRRVRDGDFILSNSMSFGRPYVVKIDGAIHDGWLLIKINDGKKLVSDYLYNILGSDSVKEQYKKLATGGVVKNLNIDLVKSIQIPLPSGTTQKQLVAEAEKEEEIIKQNQNLIKIMEKKIEKVLDNI